MSDEPTIEPTEQPTTQPEAAATPSAEAEVPKFGDLLQYAPEEYKDAKTWEKFKDTDMPTALKAIVDMDKYIGKKGDIPAEDATDEQRAEFWKKLGSDDMNIDLPELGEEFGDRKGELSEYYGGIKDKVMEIAKDVVPNAKSVPDMLNQIVSKFVEQDAASTLAQEVQARNESQQSLSELAAKTGQTVEQLTVGNQEVINKYGWDDKTSFAEVLHTLRSETSNSTTLKDALTSTAQGKQARMSEILNDGDYWNKTTENAGRHSKLVDEYKKLFDELNESS